jgi:hypothetical membrane protein
LRIGILIPFLFFGTDLVSTLFYPYSHARQHASELGAAGAPYPQIFNSGIVITGVAALLAAPGFLGALRKLTSHAALPWLVSATIICFGVAMIMSGLFPWPDPRHGAFGLVFAVPFGTILLAAALWRCPEVRWARVFLLATIAAMIPMFAVMIHVIDIVAPSNAGAFQRFYALALVPWIGVGSYALLKCTPR